MSDLRWYDIVVGAGLAALAILALLDRLEVDLPRPIAWVGHIAAEALAFVLGGWAVSFFGRGKDDADGEDEDDGPGRQMPPGPEPSSYASEVIDSAKSDEQSKSDDEIYDAIEREVEKRR